MLARYFLQKSDEYGVREGKGKGICGYDNVEKTCSFKIQSNPNSKTHINPSITVPSTNQTVGHESQHHHQ